jgi:proteasome lid subunit RPN8/RPN11
MHRGIGCSWQDDVGAMFDVAETLSIGQAHIDDMIGHARAEMPSECCGVIAMVNRVVTSVMRARNMDRSRYSFRIAPSEARELRKAIAGRGEFLGGFYHSHPNGEARLSRTDIQTLGPYFGPPLIHFVIGMAGPHAPMARAFHICSGVAVEYELTIVG